MTIITNEYIQLIKLQRPYIEGNTNGEIFSAYLEDVDSDYQDIKEYVAGANNLVDIGAGMGGIDFVLKQQNPQLTISLLDGTGVEEGEHYGYHEDLKFYSDNKIAQDFFKANNLDVNFYRADTNLTIECDTLISLNSWGFHYPITQYVDFVKNNQPQTIILDIRPKYQKLTELESIGYKFIKILRTWGTKKQRVVLVKQPTDACEPSNDQIVDPQSSSGTEPTV